MTLIEDDIEREILRCEEEEKEKKELSPQEPIDSLTDRKIANLEKILSEVKTGWTISIYRVRPSWCKGYLERIELLDDEPLDMDYLVSTWGGEVLRLRVCDNTGTWKAGADVNLRSYPPRRHEQLLTPPQYLDLPDHSGAPALPVQVSPFDAYQKFAKSFQQSRREDIELIQNLLPEHKTPENVGLENLSTLAETYQKLHGIFGNNNPVPTTTPGDDDFMGSINALLATYMKSKELDAKRQPTNETRIGPPPNHKQPALKPVAPLEEDFPTLGIMADKLASLDSTDAADVCIRALGDMPTDKRNEVMSKFIGMMNDSDYEDEEPEDHEQEIKEEAR